MKIITKKKLKEECWNLDYNIIKWINEHIKTFLSESISTIDLGKITYDGYKNKDLEQVLNELIDITDYLLTNEPYANGDITLFCKENAKEINQKKDKMYKLLSLIHWDLWV